MPNSDALTFETVTGAGAVRSTLSWTPECRLLRSFEPNGSEYEIVILAFDDNCPIVAQDTVKLTFFLKETRDQFNRFKPYDVITPNNDGVNDSFKLTGLVDPERNLPKDNCDDAFEFITIHNRYGRVVFESEVREFEWTAKDAIAGTYYYLIKFNNTNYRGVLTVLK